MKNGGLIDKTAETAAEDARLEKIENEDRNSLAEEMQELIFNPEGDDEG